MDFDEDQRTVYCGNISDKVTEELLYELFLQAGPVRRVKIPKDRDGKQMSYGFVTFKHIESVPYAISLLEGISLYERSLNLKPRQRQDHSTDRSISVGDPKQINSDHQRDFSPNNRRNMQNNYGYIESEGSNRHHMKQERRGNNRNYHDGSRRFHSSINKPYSHHKSNRNRRNHY